MRYRIYIVNNYSEGIKAHRVYIIKFSFIIYSNISLPRKGNLVLDAVYNLETCFKK